MTILKLLIRATLFSFFICIGAVYGQDAKEQITNVDLHRDGRQITIDYECRNYDSLATYFVWCDIYAHYELPFSGDSSTKSVSKNLKAQFLTGDVRYIRVGPHRTIRWDFMKDGFSKNDPIYARITATKIPDSKFVKRMLQSTIFPGWGSYKLTNNNSNMGLGFVGYGLLTTSAGLALFSHLNYRDYKKEPEHRLFNRARSQQRLATFFAISAAATWLASYVILGRQTLEIRKDALDRKNRGSDTDIYTGDSQVRSVLKDTD